MAASCGARVREEGQFCGSFTPSATRVGRSIEVRPIVAQLLPLLSSRLSSTFELLAPDLPGAGLSPIQTRPVDLDALAEWLARAIGRRSPTVPVAVVGHSLGAAVAVRSVRRLHTAALGVFSIEGNLTEVRERGFRDVRSLCRGTAASRSLEPAKGASS
jgi:pimeloyl-ACP methyl ester carboxylesterase